MKPWMIALAVLLTVISSIAGVFLGWYFASTLFHKETGEEIFQRDYAHRYSNYIGNGNFHFYGYEEPSPSCGMDGDMYSTPCEMFMRGNGAWISWGKMKDCNPLGDKIFQALEELQVPLCGPRPTPDATVDAFIKNRTINVTIVDYGGNKSDDKIV
jgi:hypothetical protein